MTPCHVVEIRTPKGVLLNGLWFGPTKPNRAIVFVHGLTASAFSMRSVVSALVDKKTAVLTFNNRGFEKITEVKQIRNGMRMWMRAGSSHEVFKDSPDDIQGAINMVKKQGVKNIYLAGHSTGAQKAYFWAAKNKGRGVRGIILLGPLSDYAIALEQDRQGKLARSVAYAKKLVRSGKPHTLMPEHLGVWFPVDAQRFLSLHTPDSAEEIFSYAQPRKVPGIVRSVKIPTLVLFAGKDEHTKTPPKKIAAWFEKHLQNGRVVIIPRTGHSFRGAEKRVAKEVRRFIAG